MHGKTALVSVLFVGGVLFCVYAFFVPPEPYAEARTIGKHVSTFKELSDRFRTLADEKGGVYAFEVLARATLPQNTDLHLLGHVVGEELYAQKGVSGIADCTQDFRNACSHSIAIGTLNEYGASGAVPLIFDACTDAPGGSGAYTMCFHGLGHGVFAYFGYSLPETISFCRTFGTPEHTNQEYIECVGGAIMELMGGGGHDTALWEDAREKYLTTPLAPCVQDVIPDDVKGICITYITPRLFELAGSSLETLDSALIPKAFSYCELIPQSYTGFRERCFGGFGKEFVVLAGGRDVRSVESFSNDMFLKAIGWCVLSGSLEAERACIGDALSSVFWGGENDTEASFRFCSLTPRSSQDACLARLGEQIVRYIPLGPRRDELCARLSGAVSEGCSTRTL